MRKTISLTTISRLLIIASLFTQSIKALASPRSDYHLMVAPGTVTESSVTLLWDKQYAKESVVYEIVLNGKTVASTGKTNYTITHLLPDTWYSVAVKLQRNKNEDAKKLNTIQFKTASKGRIFNILDYGAKNDTLSKSTRAIQAAIDACTEGGTVYIPKGIFVSSALFLKSNMTLYIEKGAVLKGSVDPEDYLPMILNRFEGWELKTYASLLNAGTLNHNGGYSVKNLRITGGGTICGGGKPLGNAMIQANGLRSRGRLICLMNCQEVSISNLTITEPPCWTIHYIYSNNISCYDLHIITDGIRNGDGMDPDSSTDCYIFNCTFDTGDDCIAIKSGKNPEGFFIARPTRKVRITDCDFKSGHGISIGSEMSGGVSNVLVQDCKAGALLHGMQIKGTKERGGYVKNVTVADCELLQITVFSELNYNNDGDAAPEIPTFENFVFKNIDMSAAKSSDAVIDINGFKDSAHRLRNVSFVNILVPEHSLVLIHNAGHIKFTNVRSVAGLEPRYFITDSSDIIY
jgi:polygalacturonase